MMSTEEFAFNENLSQNEARVLHSLVKWPDASDQEIHSQILMKKSTFSSIKTRLKEQGFYKRYYIPNFPLIGFELTNIMFGELNRFTTIEERLRIAEDTLKGYKEDFLVISENNKAFNISVSQNFTEYAKNSESFFKLYSENKFLSKDGMYVKTYPFELSRVFSFLDYESLLAKLFGFQSEPYDDRMVIPTGKVKKIKLTKAERKVLVGLVQHPDETDTLIAEQVGVSRNTVANAKRKFLKKGICFPRVVPNLEKRGSKLLAFNYRKFNPKISSQDRIDAIEMVRDKLNPHFYISKNLDGFIISAHKDYESYKEAYKELDRFYNRQEYILDEPISYTFELPEMTIIKPIDFLPMIMKQLNFNPDLPLIDQG